MTKTASEVLEKHFGHFNPNHPIDCLGYAKGVHPDIEDIILAMEEYRNQPQPLPSDINDFIEKEYRNLSGGAYMEKGFKDCYNTYVEPLKEDLKSLSGDIRENKNFINTETDPLLHEMIEIKHNRWTGNKIWFNYSDSTLHVLPEKENPDIKNFIEVTGIVENGFL